MSREKRKGTVFEAACERWLSKFHAVRTALHGKYDQGDIRITAGGKDIVIECKNHREYREADFVDQASVESDNAGAWMGVVMMKRRGKGLSDMGKHYVLMESEDFLKILEALDEQAG